MSFRCFAKSEKKHAVDLIGKIHREEPKYPPEIKKVADVKMPTFSETLEEGEEEAKTLKYSPNKFMKYMDTSMEKFFYQREYTLKNFNFYLQVLTSQYKAEEAKKVISKMVTLGISPDSESYNHLVTVHAKLGELDKVEEIIAMGK